MRYKARDDIMLLIGRRKYLRSAIVFMLIIVLLFTIYMQPAKAAFTLSSGAVALILCFLAALGVTFTFQNSTEARSGIEGLVNGFLETKDNALEAFNALVPDYMLDNFLMFGTISVFKDNAAVWNEFVEWVKLNLGVGIDIECEYLGNGSYIIDGIYIYSLDLSQSTNLTVWKSQAKSEYGEVIYRSMSPVVSNTVDNPCFIFENNRNLYLYREGSMTYFNHLDGRTGWGIGITSYTSVVIFYDANIESFCIVFPSNYFLVARDTRPLTYAFLENALISATMVPPLDVSDVVGIPDVAEGEEVAAYPLPDVWTGTDVIGGVSEETLEGIIEGVGTGAMSVTKGLELVDTDTPPGPDPDGDDSDEYEEYLTPGLTTVFPFCIPFDLIALVSAFNAKAEVPIFKIPISMSFIGYHDEIIIDFTVFEPVAEVVRWGVTMFFILGLIIVTRKMIQG